MHLVCSDIDSLFSSSMADRIPKGTKQLHTDAGDLSEKLDAQERGLASQGGRAGEIYALGA